MRTAAGVLLIVVAVINLFGAIFYFSLGGVAKLSALAAEQSKREGRAVPPETERNAEMLRNVPGRLGTTSGALMGYSVFLLVTVGTSIAGAVCLFRQRAAKFIIAAGILVAVPEVIGSILLRFGWRNIPGILAAIFALVGARSIMIMSRPMDPMPPPSAGVPT